MMHLTLGGFPQFQMQDGYRRSMIGRWFCRARLQPAVAGPREPREFDVGPKFASCWPELKLLVDDNAQTSLYSSAAPDSWHAGSGSLEPRMERLECMGT